MNIVDGFSSAQEASKWYSGHQKGMYVVAGVLFFIITMLLGGLLWSSASLYPLNLIFLTAMVFSAIGALLCVKWHRSMSPEHKDAIQYGDDYVTMLENRSGTA